MPNLEKFPFSSLFLRNATIVAVFLPLQSIPQNSVPVEENLTEASRRQKARIVVKTREIRIARIVRNPPQKLQKINLSTGLRFRIPLYLRLLPDAGFGFCFGFQGRGSFAKRRKIL